MAEVSERTPLLSNDSSNEILVQCEQDVPHFESSKSNENISRVVAVNSDTYIEKSGRATDGDDEKEHVGEVEVKVEPGEVYKKSLEQSVKFKFLLSRPPKNAGDLARVAAHTSRTAASQCRIIVNDTRNALDLGKREVDKAIRRAEVSSNSEGATRYRILANKYDAAVKLANKRVLKMEVAAESAENASMEAEDAADQVTEISDETDPSEAQEKLLTAYCAANTANMAAIVAYKMEYCAVKAMKKYWQDLDTDIVEAARHVIRSANENPRNDVDSQFHTTTLYFHFSSFMIGILIIAILGDSKEKSTYSRATYLSLVSVASLLITIPLLYLLYMLLMWYRNERKVSLRRKDKTIIVKMNKRLKELEKYFESNEISPVHSESDDLDE